MAAVIFCAGVALTVAKKTSKGIQRAGFERTTKDVKGGLGIHGFNVGEGYLGCKAAARLPSRQGRPVGHAECMSSIYETLRADIIVAMKARESVTTMALRTADAAIKRAAMDGNKEIDDGLSLATLRKAVKNLTDANAEFTKGGRPDLVAANDIEIKILQKYLPAGLDAAKLDALIAEAIARTGATTKKEMGKVIGSLKAHPDAALIDFGAVSKLVQSKLV